MSHFAVAVTRGVDGWAAAELGLSGAADIDEVTDRLRDAAPEASVSLLFVESDDAYLVIVRLDDGEDPKVFGSDSAFAEESRLGALLLGEVEVPALDLDPSLDAVLDVDDTDVDIEVDVAADGAVDGAALGGAAQLAGERGGAGRAGGGLPVGAGASVGVASGAGAGAGVGVAAGIRADRPVAEPDVDPVGDPELLADLGMPAQRLLRLCAQDGMLPADITAEVCHAIGCGDEVEELRDT